MTPEFVAAASKVSTALRSAMDKVAA